MRNTINVVGGDVTYSIKRMYLTFLAKGPDNEH